MAFDLPGPYHWRKPRGPSNWSVGLKLEHREGPYAYALGYMSDELEKNGKRYVWILRFDCTKSLWSTLAQPRWEAAEDLPPQWFRRSDLVWDSWDNGSGDAGIRDVCDRIR